MNSKTLLKLSSISTLAFATAVLFGGNAFAVDAPKPAADAKTLTTEQIKKDFASKILTELGKDTKDTKDTKNSDLLGKIAAKSISGVGAVAKPIEIKTGAKVFVGAGGVGGKDLPTEAGKDANLVITTSLTDASSIVGSISIDDAGAVKFMNKEKVPVEIKDADLSKVFGELKEGENNFLFNVSNEDGSVDVYGVTVKKTTTAASGSTAASVAYVSTSGKIAYKIKKDDIKNIRVDSPFSGFNMAGVVEVGFGPVKLGVGTSKQFHVFKASAEIIDGIMDIGAEYDFSSSDNFQKTGYNLKFSNISALSTFKYKFNDVFGAYVRGKLGFSTLSIEDSKGSNKATDLLNSFSYGISAGATFDLISNIKFNAGLGFEKLHGQAVLDDNAGIAGRKLLLNPASGMIAEIGLSISF